MVRVLNGFDICGYCTEASALTKYRKVNLLIFTVHYILAILFSYYGFQVFVELYPLIGLLETLNELVQYTVALFTYWLILFDSLRFRQKHRRFWQIVQRIDQHFCAQTEVLRSFSYKIIEYFPVTLCLYTMIFAMGATPQTGSVYIFFALIAICHLRVFYYMYCLQVVDWQLKMIENEIVVIKNNLPHVLNKRYRFDLNRFRWINQYYYCVIEMTVLLNDIFGVSQIALILLGFYSFLTNLNWFYMNVDRLSVTQISCEF